MKSNSLIVVSLIFLSSLYCNVHATVPIIDAVFSSNNPIVQNSSNIMAYLPLLVKAQEDYLKKNNNSEPTITCKNCTKNQLNMSDFGGNLIGKSMKDVIEGQNNFEQIKSLLDEFLKVVSDGDTAEITKYMVRVANEIKQTCTHCYYQGEGNYWE